MLTTQSVRPARARLTYLPGFEPFRLDPILKTLSGKKLTRQEQETLFGSAVKATPKKKPTTASMHRLLAAHLAQSGGFYPDEVVDTESKRERDSEDVLKRLMALAAAYPGGLKFYRLTLSNLDGRCLYDPETVEVARKHVRRWLRARGLRGEWKLERGRCGGTHVHIVTSAAAGAGGKDVYDLDGLACYLVKPPDARACLPKKEEKAQYTARELKEQKDQAAEDYLAAAAALASGAFGQRQRLPRMGASCR